MGVSGDLVVRVRQTLFEASYSYVVFDWRASMRPQVSFAVSRTPLQPLKTRSELLQQELRDGNYDSHLIPDEGKGLKRTDFAPF